MVIAKIIALIALALALCGPDSYEPDATQSSAKTYQLGQLSRHTFHSPLDVDVLRYELTQGRAYTFSTTALSASSDPFMTLYNKDNQQLAFNDDIDTARCRADEQEFCNARVRWLARYTGDYYVAVLNFGTGSAEVCPAYAFVGQVADTYLPLISSR